MSYIWTFFGTVFLLLGIVGVFLPLLPTIPFLLLTAYCWARGSPRLYNWLMQNRWFGRYIREWRDGRGISARSKALAVALIALSVGYSVLLPKLHLAVKLLHGSFVVLAGIYILTRPTRHDK
ncbi:MAG: YbaN family protein [bacterium]|nr:YbaN family protein [bacterium]